MHFTKALYLLVIGFLNARIGESIRVDWNTNKGPIVPPTPRTTQRPQLPYRQPAPVWEDQSDDIPNPNPYVYVLPPPSRPRSPTNNYLTADRRPVTQHNYYLYNNQNHYDSSLIPPIQSASTDYYQQQRSNGRVAAGLSPKYIPNIGFKYYAIVPNYNGNNNGKSINSSANNNNSSNAYYNDKLQGKYNPKTKKYKAYEKVKYVPPNYYPYNELALTELTPYRPIFDQYDQMVMLTTQQLPATEIVTPFTTATINKANFENIIKNITPLPSIQNEEEQQAQQSQQQQQPQKLQQNHEQQKQQQQQQEQQVIISTQRNPIKENQKQKFLISKIAYSKNAIVFNEKHRKSIVQPSKYSLYKDNMKSSFPAKPFNNKIDHQEKGSLQKDTATDDNNNNNNTVNASFAPKP